MTGRPPVWVGEKLERAKAEILDRVSAGEMLISICKDERLPSPKEVNRWVAEDAAFGLALARAKEAAADVIAEEAVAVTDEEKNPHRARVRSEARRWYAARMNPQRYGERINLDVTQQVDLRGAMQAAEARVLRPIRDQQTRRLPQVIDHPPQTPLGSTDSQSVDAPERANPETPSDDEHDIFS